MRFIHVVDVHLGYQQYGLKERFNDYSRVFLHVVDQAVEQQVDFLLMAGDLFEKRTVDPSIVVQIHVPQLRVTLKRQFVIGPTHPPSVAHLAGGMCRTFGFV